MKVIMVSKVFPKKHPRAGEPTWFVQKILHSLLPKGYKPATQIAYPKKVHTIRAGKRWKVGEMASIRVWTGLPYRSPQKEICQVEIKQIWNITIEPHLVFGFAIHINGHYVADWKPTTANIQLKHLAKNDGLSKEDFIAWFPRQFAGQIICWSDKIEYQ